MEYIKIKVFAFGFTDDYEGLELNQEKLIIKDLENNQFTESNCREIIRKMIDAVNENKLLFSKNKNLLENKLESIRFEISYETNDGSIISYEENSFFNEAAKYGSLTNDILNYVTVTDNGDEGTRIWIPEDDNYETYPAGTFAILALIEHDKKWIKEYIDFLRTNDLDHEMMQLWQIKSIIDKYGWCEETIKLAIARNISCCGQGGKEQFNTFVEGGLSAYIADKEKRKLFIQNIISEFDGWDKLEFRLKDGSEKYYSNYIVAYAKHFKALLSENEIEYIENYLMQKWKDYNKN